MLEIIESSYQPRITLDREDPVYRGGEVVRGSASVRGIEGGGTLNALIVTIEWRTVGESNQDRGPVRMVRLPVETPSPGALVEAPFSLELPSGPISYAGQLFSVEWFVAVRADVALARDPRSELMIEVVPPPPADLVVERDGYREPAWSLVPEGRHYERGPRLRRAGSRVSRPSLGSGLGMITFGGLILPLLALKDGCGEAGVLMGLLAFGTLGAGIAVVRQALRLRRSRRGLGEPAVLVEPTEVVRGHVLGVRVSLAPDGLVEMVGATVELEATESATSGSGSSATTHHRRVRSILKNFDCPRQVSPHERVGLEEQLTVPADAPPTFGAPNNELTWIVKVTVTAARPSRQVVEETVVHVLPV